jgi:hypothetical protein
LKWRSPERREAAVKPYYEHAGIGQVIDIGEFRISMANEHRFDAKTCKHNKITMHPEGEYLTCDECNQAISAYWFIGSFFRRYDEYREKIEQRAKEIAAAEERTLVLRAAQVVEDAWKRRKFQPTCPHCHRPIGPNDGFGRSQCRVISRAEKRAKEKIK